MSHHPNSFPMLRPLHRNRYPVPCPCGIDRLAPSVTPSPMHLHKTLWHSTLHRRHSSVDKPFHCVFRAPTSSPRRTDSTPHRVGEYRPRLPLTYTNIPVSFVPSPCHQPLVFQLRLRLFLNLDLSMRVALFRFKRRHRDDVPPNVRRL